MSGPESFVPTREVEKQCEEARIKEERRKIELGNFFMDPQVIKNLNLQVQFSGNTGEPLLFASMPNHKISGVVNRFVVYESQEMFYECQRWFNDVFVDLIRTRKEVKRLDRPQHEHIRLAPAFIFRKYVPGMMLVKIGKDDFYIHNVRIQVSVEYCFMNFDLRGTIYEHFCDLREIERELLDKTPFFENFPEIIDHSPSEFAEIIKQKINNQLQEDIPEWVEAEELSLDIIEQLTESSSVIPYL